MATDRKNNILQPTDIITVNMKSGKKKAKILSIFNNEIKAQLIESKKTINLDSRKHRNLIDLYEISNAFAKQEKVIQPLISKMLNQTTNETNDEENTLNPSISISEMKDFGIKLGKLNEKEQYSYDLKQVIKLLKEAKEITRNHKSLEKTSYLINGLINKIKTV
jgi:hypothetical protein